MPSEAPQDGAGGDDIGADLGFRHAVADAINGASDECCEVHVADVHDDEVYDAVAQLLSTGVPLWRRSGFLVPDTPAGLDGPDIDLGDT